MKYKIWQVKDTLGNDLTEKIDCSLETFILPNGKLMHYDWENYGGWEMVEVDWDHYELEILE